MEEVFNNISNFIDPDLVVSTSTIGTGEYDTLVKIASMVVNLVIGVGFSISIMAVAFSAIKHTMSGGDPKKTSEAWNAFLYAVIAGMISLAAVLLKVIMLKLVGVETTGVSLLEGGGK